MVPSGRRTVPALRDRPSIPANAIMPKPLPTRRRASRRVVGFPGLCAIIFLIDEHEFARAEEYLDVASPRRGLVFHFGCRATASAAASHSAEHTHTHFGDCRHGRSI